MIIHKTPYILKLALPKYRWQVKTQAKQIFLTFDDGPIPEVTEFVLNTLKSFQARATFFCVGENIHKYPHILHKILANGHTVGNHTHNHLNGWKTSTDKYIENVYKCQAAIDLHLTAPSKGIFRPPYGRISRKQASLLLPNFDIIMWDVLTADYNIALSPELCLQKSIAHARPGSIVLFHDSLKSERNLRYVLPRFLEHFANQGYEFKAL
jgi:peptidoglycan/xylan/chitin deacetylase (PgdA/CDA1 family)